MNGGPLPPVAEIDAQAEDSTNINHRPSDTETSTSHDQEFEFAENEDSYTKLVNALYTQSSKKMMKLKKGLSIVEYCPFYFRCLREIDKLDEHAIIQSFAHEFNFNRIFTCEMYAPQTCSVGRRFFFHTQDHKYKLMQISNWQKVAYLDLLLPIYEHVKQGYFSDRSSSRGLPRAYGCHQSLLQRIYGV